jgi:hypothetical protein
MIKMGKMAHSSPWSEREFAFEGLAATLSRTTIHDPRMSSLRLGGGVRPAVQALLRQMPDLLLRWFLGLLVVRPADNKYVTPDLPGQVANPLLSSGGAAGAGGAGQGRGRARRQWRGWRPSVPVTGFARCAPTPSRPWQLGWRSTPQGQSPYQHLGIPWRKGMR